MGSIVGRLPFTLAEHALVQSRRKGLERPHPPVFILGHWRSGTTHLYNVLGKSPALGYVSPLATGLPWDMLVLARWLRPVLAKMLPNERYIDRLPVELTSPQEDEAALANMQGVSYYHGLYFPRQLRDEVMRGVFFDGVTPAELRRWEERFTYFVDKVQMAFPGRRLVLKNPVYTARVAQIRKLYPDAQFVHIHRHPIEVFRSMRHFYEKLLKQMTLQDYDLAAVDDLVLEVYPRMMQAQIEQTRDLPADRYIELRYDELDDEPLLQVQRIFEQLGWDGFEASKPAFEAYLKSVASYKKNQLSLPDDLKARVWGAWRDYFDRWGYTKPTMDQAGG